MLLGQIVDTNSSWIGEQLARSGIDCHFQTKVGDNLERMVLAMRTALARSDAVLVCGGLGPTQDDITREAIAVVMNVPLVLDEDIVARIRTMFASRGRAMAANNSRQAEVPVGASVIEQRIGTAPGLICPVGQKVIYAMPGVPYEMHEMMDRAILPDLRLRAGDLAVISSRTLRTWGLAESTLAELLEPRIDALAGGGAGVPTIAFLASGIEGIKVRLTVKAASEGAAASALGAEEELVRAVLGDAVFGVDDGLMASRVVSVPGASEWFAGAVVAYGTSVKESVLGVPAGPVVSAAAAAAMAEGARDLLKTDVAIATTGVAGPAEQEGNPPGTVFIGICLPGSDAEGVELRLPGDRERVRQMTVISALNLLRLRLNSR